jgi:predicted ribosome quality control (RQC) complex YloA/Tae2 family protein
VTALAALVGARLRRIDAPSPDLWALTLAAGDLRGTLLISLQPSAAGVGWLERRPQGLPASSFVQKLRKEIEGGRVRGFDAAGPRLTVRVTRSEQDFQLGFDFDAQNVLLHAGEKLIASAHKPAPAAEGGGREVHWPATLELLAEQGEQLIESRADSLLAQQRSMLTKAVSAARKRLLRKLEAQRGDAKRAELAPELRRRAQLLMAQQHAIARGTQSAKLLDYGVDPPEWVELTLDSKLSAREQAELWFKQAKRFDRGAGIAQQRAAAGEKELAALDALRDQLTTCETAEHLAELIARAGTLGLQAEGAGTPTQRKEPPKRVPYRALSGSGGRKILVGKGAADNDELTLQFARPHDLWLHARDVSGAHVVVPLEKNEVCPQELLLDAAHLAAHFSDARGERIAEVTYTPRKYVRKPKGAAVGSVVVEREKVLRLVVEEARLARLLAD